MRKLILLLAFVTLAHHLDAQHSRRAANGFTVRPFFHQQGINYYLHDMDSKGNIYAIYYDTVTSGFNFGGEYSQIRVQVYDGVSWLISKPVRLFSRNTIYAPRILDIKVYKGDVYVSGSFDSSQGNLGGGILKFSNRAWQSAGVFLEQTLPDYFEVNKMIPYGNNLYIAGNFDSIAGTRVNGLLLFDGSTWTPVGNAGTYGFRGNSSTANVMFAAVDDSLYAFNRTRINPDSIEIGGTVSRNLSILKNGAFEEVGTPARHITHVSAFRKNLVVIPASSLLYVHSLLLRSGNQWTSYALPDSFYTTNFLGTLSMPDAMYLAFQNPNTKQADIYAFDGTAITRKKSFKVSDIYLALECRSQGSQMSLSGNFTWVKQGAFMDSARTIVRLVFEPACIFTGTTFLDQNSDGLRQAGEPSIPYATVADISQGVACQSDGKGNFNMELPINNTYTFAAAEHKGFVNTNSYILASATDSVYVRDIGLKPSGFDDAGVAVFCHTANKAKQGFETKYTLFANNYSGNTKNISIRVQYDKRCSSLKTSNFTPASQSAGVFFINKSMPAQSEASFEFSMVYAVDSFSLGEKVLVSAALQSPDVITRNNLDTITQLVVSAFDPNIKVAYPSAIVNSDHEIKYVIYFQNEGNDTAINVTVVDTLGTLFDLSKVVYRGVSHSQCLDNGRPSVNNNVLIWHFSNIKLPPKKVDSARSMGYVLISTFTNQNARIGDSILNKAAIFFDYQKPVITNKAKVVIVRNTAENDPRIAAFDIYPNPGNGTFLYKNPQHAGETLYVYDSEGRIVFSAQVQREGVIVLPGNIASGVYFLRLDSIDVGKLIIEN